MKWLSLYLTLQVSLSLPSRVLGIIVIPQTMQLFSINVTIGGFPTNAFFNTATSTSSIPTKNCTLNKSCTVEAGLELYDPTESPEAQIQEAHCMQFNGIDFCGNMVTDKLDMDPTTSLSFGFLGTSQSPKYITRPGQFDMGTTRLTEPGSQPNLIQQLLTANKISIPTISFYTDPAAEFAPSTSQNPVGIFSDAKNSFVAFGAAPSGASLKIPANTAAKSWNFGLNSIASQSVNVSVEVMTQIASSTASENLLPTIYGAIGMTEEESQACIQAYENCVPRRLAAATLPLVFNGNAKTLNVPAVNCNDEGCWPTFLSSGPQVFQDIGTGVSLSGDLSINANLLRSFIVTFDYDKQMMALDSAASDELYRDPAESSKDTTQSSSTSAINAASASSSSKTRSNTNAATAVPVAPLPAPPLAQASNEKENKGNNNMLAWIVLGVSVFILCVRVAVWKRYRV